MKKPFNKDYIIMCDACEMKKPNFEPCVLKFNLDNLKEKKTMKFWEAIKAMQEGKKIRCKTWPKWYFDDLKGGNLINISCPSMHKYANSKWELYEEPEKLLTWEQVLIGLNEGKKFRRNSNKGSWKNTKWYLTLYRDEIVGFYSDKEEAEEIFFTLEDFEADDWMEIK